MNASSDRILSKENQINAISGWPMLALNLLGWAAAVYIFKRSLDFGLDKSSCAAKPMFIP